jgi:hypothetical protein
MKNKSITLAVAIALIFSDLYACDVQGTTGFMPNNNLRISKNSKATNGMTKDRFEQIVNRVYLAYSEIVKAKGATLEMNNNWDDGTVNAYANRIGSIWHVNMFGGLARHPLVTDDGFLLVVCHETGHHVGGAPKFGGFGNVWASNEGQADYFGALKCMKRILEKDDNQTIVSKTTLDPEAKLKCEMVYKSGDDIALCERIAMAGKSLANLLADLGGNSSVAFITPDKSEVFQTINSHPQAQCRLDTYFSGALCDKAFSENVSETNPIDGTCIKKDGYTTGVRPLCWYRPSASEI